MSEENFVKQGERKNGKNRWRKKECLRFNADCLTKSPSERLTDKIVKPRKSSKHLHVSTEQTLIVRKQVDPETTKYFSEIANLFEGTTVDLDDRSAICGNALEETRGKELELATDYIISHTLQTLLEGCDIDHLCGFLQSCAKEFHQIAMDKSGSHVVETALRSLAVHIQDEGAYSVIGSTLNKICQEIVLNLACVMCSQYGSHVLRSLLCLCKGLPLDSTEEFHVTKSSSILAERLNFKSPQSFRNKVPHLQQGFPDLLRYLIAELLKCARGGIATLLVDEKSSYVMQTALRLLAGEDQELMHAIPILLGCSEKNIAKGKFIEASMVQDILATLKDTAYSHLMEVILEVAPETLYNEILTKVFKNSLFEISCDHCGSFVVQALVSSARCQDQIELFWEELGSKFKELLGIGRAGVVASLLAASQKLHTHENKCCQALAAAVYSESEPPSCILPRILFLENYFSCEDESNWSWGKGDKMHVLGCLMLQTVFRYPSEFIQPFVTSITSLEADHVLEVANDAGGGRVIEAFLSSNASIKQKRRLIVKLRGYFGELSLHPSSSFTVEKCFSASNASLQEAIASELLDVRTALSKTKQGPYILRKLEIDGFATRPDQWRLRQTSKQSAYKEFFDAFGSSDTKSSGSNSIFGESSSGTRHSKSLKTMKKMKKDVEQCLAYSNAPSLGSQLPVIDSSITRFDMSKRGHEKANKIVRESVELDLDNNGMRIGNQKRKRMETDATGNSAAASKTTENARDKKNRRKENGSISSLKKLKK
ncbi:pumilio homolog 23 isoform X1 [Telopea speciosissima]|uniref:pumilio homolog 23 isoform X1 n=1 Tax=Telopea speciosissima TaxID=54955 RepID=UPI001CC42729|nr:pumilio homolog 23 isoform X1 [Telopea speciosissima]